MQKPANIIMIADAPEQNRFQAIYNNADWVGWNIKIL